MIGFQKTFAVFLVALAAAQPVAAGQFVIEPGAPLAAPPATLMSAREFTLDEALSGGADSYAVFSAADTAALQDFLKASSIDAEKISEVLFVNSPTVGGGEPAGPEPHPGQQVFVIERPIPGVGFFDLEKKQKISRNSNAAIAKLGDVIEWDHSYLTSEGTYCVYRADSPETLREHGALAGAPIGKITPVEQHVFR
jgi:Nickel responsive protein SCO4226-like